MKMEPQLNLVKNTRTLWNLLWNHLEQLAQLEVLMNVNEVRFLSPFTPISEEVSAKHWGG